MCKFIEQNISKTIENLSVCFGRKVTNAFYENKELHYHSNCSVGSHLCQQPKFECSINLQFTREDGQFRMILSQRQRPLSGHSLGSGQSLERRSSCSKSWSASSRASPPSSSLARSTISPVFTLSWKRLEENNKILSLTPMSSSPRSTLKSGGFEAAAMWESRT